MESNFEYEGGELELFSKADHWKSYFRSQLSPFISGRVLEVGAGIGATTAVFQNVACESWTCLEPDARLLDQLKTRLATLPTSDLYRYMQGTLENIEPAQTFDSILYIDVLEHIEYDDREVQQAARLLKTGGQLIILSPAYQYLYSPFDAKIGHFRRYTLGKLRKLTPANCQVKKGFYLDSAGLLASLANKLFLKASLPNPKQIKFWDSYLVRSSRLLDLLFFFSFGRSVIIVWEKQ